MEKVLLGKSNLSVSKLGLGIGGIFGMHVFNEKKAISLIHKSIDLGLNFLTQVVLILMEMQRLGLEKLCKIKIKIHW